MKRIICMIIAFLLLFFECTHSQTCCAVGTSAAATALINGDTGEVIYESNSDACLPMASTTKIMTALLLCELADPQKSISVTADMLRVEGSSMGLLPGDTVTYYDLLYGMMLASGNDAANVTAISIAGSVDKFVELMNEKAVKLGLNSTHFVTPSGLDGEGHCTSAMDLALLAKYALHNSLFTEAAASESKTLKYGNPPYKRTLKNHNRLLQSFEGAVGVKTGFTKKAGRCLVSAAKRDGKFVIAVTLKDPNDWDDHAGLLEYGLESIKQSKFTPKFTSYYIPVVGSETEKIKIDIKPFTVNTLEVSDITYKICIPKFLYAPIKSDDIVGSIKYQVGNSYLGEKPLTAGVDVDAISKKPDIFTRVFKNIKNIVIGIWEK